MKQRLSRFLILLSFLLASAGAAQAQAPVPPNLIPAPPPVQPPSALDAWPDALRAPQFIAPAAELTTQGMALGQPGLSFRYVNTFGQTGVAYPGDTSHLNYPWGLGVDSSSGSVWIGELWGNRAMKYSSGGIFQQSIGFAGSGYLTNTIALWEIADVGIDNSGNVWVVDDAASHITEFSSSGTFIKELGVPWSSGTDNGHFASPVSIAFDAAGNIYVSDGSPWWEGGLESGNQRIQIFNPSGSTRLATIGATGVMGTTNNRLHGPGHIAIDQFNKRLYVADTGNHRVQIFNIANPAAPAYVATLGTTGVSGSDNLHFNRPTGVAVASDYMYVADTLNNRVMIFNRTAPYAWVKTLGVTGEAGSDQGHFNRPTDVAVDGGNVYIADFVNTRVQEFTHVGTVFNYVRTHGTAGIPYLTDSSHYNHPSSVAVDRIGNIILTEDSGQRLIKLNAAGTKLWVQGSAGVKGDWDNGNSSFNNAADVAVDYAGNVYVADRWHQRVQEYNPSGGYLRSIMGLNCPGGVHIAPTGYIYVADACEQTVQIYNPNNLSIVGMLGVHGVSGSDNAHFNSPEDVAVDGNGTIYVSDQNNHRVQVFDSNRAYVRTIGVTGSCAADFGHFCWPDGLFVDGANRLYVADSGNNRVQVFAPTGGYLTTIADTWGTGNSEMRSPTGVAVDSGGNVYVADRNNHRIQKFARGVPGWSQVNLNGFGDRTNGAISSLAPFAGKLYAGVTSGNGVKIWRSSNGTTWSLAAQGAFGNPAINGIDDLIEFNGNLYAGLWSCGDVHCNVKNGGEIWRSADGSSWTQVVGGGFSGTANGQIYKLMPFNGAIYAATWTWDSSAHGGEIWRSATGDPNTWVRVLRLDQANPNDWAVASLEVFNGYLYAGTYNEINGAEVWRCSICSGPSMDWALVNLDGFGDAANHSVSSLATFGSALYASTINAAGIEIWRCTVCDGTDWTQVSTNGFGDGNNNGDSGGELFKGQLYFVVDNRASGVEVWRCTICDGTDWAQAGFEGFGDGNNGLLADKTALFNNRLYIGTYNYGNGGEIWAPPALAYPVVNSIRLANPSPTNASVVSFIVTFSENVTGVNAGDFKLTTTSRLPGASIKGVQGTGDTYFVSVAPGTGNGTLRLDLADDDSIVDQLTGTHHLGGDGAANGNFTAGASYVIPASTTFRSFAAQDGFVLESGENTSAGGTIDALQSVFYLGDDNVNRQYRSILSFKTGDLPDTAVVASLTLKIKQAGAAGANPFATLGPILVDIKKGYFGTSLLQATDFQAAPTGAASMTIKNNPLTGGWFYASLGSTSNNLISKPDNTYTQMRLRFKTDDNNNRLANTLSFFSGNALAPADRPMLIVQYYIP